MDSTISLYFEDILLGKRLPGSPPKVTVYYEGKRLLPDYDLVRVLQGFIQSEIKPYEGNIDYLKLKSDEIFVGDIWKTEKVLKQNGLTWNKRLDYPEEIKGFYGRNIERTTLDRVLSRDATYPKFVKPVCKGLFTPFVHNQRYDPYSLMHVDPECEVWMQDAIQVEGEYRVFVCDRQILDVRNYRHWEFRPPERDWLQTIIGQLPYDTYILDVGSVNDSFKVIEVNDGICFGTYGLQPEHCAMMYKYRFKELWRKNEG